MFRIKQAVSVHTTQHNALTQESEEPLVEHDEVLITFDNSKSTIFNRQQLCEHFDGISLQEDQEELDFRKTSQSNFDVITALVIEKKPLFQSLSENFYTNPFLCEELLALLEIMTPKKKEEIFALISNQIAYLTLPQAIVSIQAYAPFNEGKNIPLLVKEAETILMKAKIFFTNQSQAAEFFCAGQIYNKELCLCQTLAKDLEEALINPRNDIQKKLLTQQMKGVKEQIYVCETQLKQQNDTLDVNKLSLTMLLHTQKYATDENNETRKILKLAQTRMEKYRVIVMEALEASGANMSRNDLIEWIVGPKGFILDYYGLHYDPTNRKEYPFIINRQSTGYRLANEGPYALEEEIRNDIRESERNPKLPDRLISGEERTKQIAEEVKKFYPTLLPFFKKFPTPETQVGTEVYKEVIDILWKYNGWDKLKVLPENIILDTADRTKDPILVKGTVKLGIEEVSFHFTLDDLILLIPHENKHMIPDCISTKERIEMYIDISKRRYGYYA